MYYVHEDYYSVYPRTTCVGRRVQHMGPLNCRNICHFALSVGREGGRWVSLMILKCLENSSIFLVDNCLRGEVNCWVSDDDKWNPALGWVWKFHFIRKMFSVRSHCVRRLKKQEAITRLRYTLPITVDNKANRIEMEKLWKQKYHDDNFQKRRASTRLRSCTRTRKLSFSHTHTRSHARS